MIVAPDGQVFLVWALELFLGPICISNELWMERECSVARALQPQFFFTARMRFKSIFKRACTNLITVITPAPVLEDELAVLLVLDVLTVTIVGGQTCCDIEALS